MLNTLYQLTAPRRFEAIIQDVNVKHENGLVCRPTHLSICNADQRYYQGTRGAEVLAKKLPMALIHEAIGEVVYDSQKILEPGTPVVMIPNLPVESHPIIAENYLRSSKFRASSADGFTQELIATKHDRVVTLPDNLDKNIAAFTELVSVMTHVIKRFDAFSYNGDHTVGFWGDGNVGFIGSLLYKQQHPNSKVFVIGKNEDKLSDFTFADGVLLTSELSPSFKVDHAFECAGGIGSISAIEQIIDHIQPEGTIALCGVSENPIPVNTRMILEKGLRLFGSSRSGRSDFEDTFELYKQHPAIPEYLKRIVGNICEVNTIDDLNGAFETDIQKRLGKTIMHWNM